MKALLLVNDVVMDGTVIVEQMDWGTQVGTNENYLFPSLNQAVLLHQCVQRTSQHAL